MRFLILHGPNLNLFGRREPHIYGTMTLAEIDRKLEALASELKVSLSILQSNHEGALLDFLHANMDKADGAVINPAALTQHGVGLHDCIKAMPFPCIEAHMSNIKQREEWRHHSIIAPAVKATIQGLGWRSYTMALRALVEMGRERKTSGKKK
jgi:3-dehydroquinate dehydratase II